MEYKPKKRDWVKNAAIIFLSVLLVLTFFSNTLMNRSLPEVATQSVTNGTITAKVRGTGTVTAVGVTTMKAEQTRDIRAVMVKVGQEVEVGDVLFVLGQGEASALEAAQEQLRQLQLSYQKTAVGVISPDYSLQEHQIANARQAVQDARNYLQEVIKRRDNPSLPIDQLEAAQADVTVKGQLLDEAKINNSSAQSALDNYSATYGEEMDLLNSEISGHDHIWNSYDAAVVRLDELRRLWYQQQGREPLPGEEIVTEEMLDAADELVRTLQDEKTDWVFTFGDIEAIRNRYTGLQTELKEKQDYLSATKQTCDEAQAAYDEAVQKLKAVQATIDEIIGQEAVSTEYKDAQAAVQAAEDRLFELEYNLQQQKVTDSKSQSMDYLSLSDIGAQIEAAKKKVEELSGGEENQVVAKVHGTVQSIECAPGDTKVKGDILCTIEVPDMGYSLSFSVTNDQARRLKVGDSATVSNYYWGNQVTATLESIKTDPKNPQTNKILNFNVTGDVTAGSEITISVGQKSANYDIIIPNSAIRSDTNGSFVLAVESKSSPLGNRYIARRVEVKVLAEDDMNSAVTADLGFGDYVITTSNAPVKNGDMVRLADN